ncbi:hypothetical protein DVH05_005434 [Phytophthora capsici]|nr:hypothetical protein DVH05_014234 [Phytophthora capsici]KAG1704504.1 hypothetical protein DVH05_005434 [Phytophthora capsici]
MSSLRIRTKNKLLTVLGAAKPSTNVAYDMAYSDFESTLQRLTTLDSALKSYAGSLKTFHGSASSVVGAIDGLSSGGTGTASFQQKPVGASDMQQFAGEARVACADVDMMVLQETYGRLEQEVLLPVKGWLQHAQSLQNATVAFLETKALYDHYSRKVIGLREAHEKRASNGRSEKTKETERMFRNEQKLASTTQDYTRLSDTIIRDLRAFVMSRDAALAPLLRRVLRGRVVYAERINEATGRIRALIEDGVEESEDGGVLGQFMTVAQKGGHVGSEVIMAAATAPLPAPCTVRKSSFEEFVGESPYNSPQKSASVNGGGWDAFSTPPPENEIQTPTPANGGYGFSEPNYTPPHAVPQFMTVNTPSNAASHSWGDDFPAPVFSTMPANGASASGMPSASGMSMAPSPPPSPTSVAMNPWDAFPAASAPMADSFGQWGTGSGQNSFQQQQQQQPPVSEFRDMHLNALGSFR